MVNSRHPRPAVSSSRLSGTALALSGTLAVALQAGIPLLAGEIACLAVADDGTPLGSIAAGSFVSTQASDDVAEELREMLTSGSPKTRKSMLEHAWRFDVTAGNNYELAVEAWHTPNTEHDDFRFSFSRDDVSYTPLLTVTAVADTDTVQATSMARRTRVRPMGWRIQAGAMGFWIKCAVASAAESVMVMTKSVRANPRRTRTKTLPFQRGSSSSSIRMLPCPLGLRRATSR